MLFGTRHAEQLLASVMTLRDYHSEPVCVACGDRAGLQVAKLLEADRRLNVQVISWDAPTGQRGMAYAHKTRMFDLSPFSQTVFLDADTLVVGSLTELFPTNEVVLTPVCEMADGTNWEA